MPEQVVAARLEQFKRGQEIQRAAATQAAAYAEQQRRAMGRRGDGAEVAALKQRIAELERRNAQLEAQVQLLKELVQGRQGQGQGAEPDKKP